MNSQLGHLVVEAKFKIKNSEHESEAYLREIARMQVLDRVRLNVESNTCSKRLNQQSMDLID